MALRALSSDGPLARIGSNIVVSNNHEEHEYV